MLAGNPRITHNEIIRATIPMPGMDNARKLTPEEILLLSDPTPGFQVPNPDRTVRQGIFSRFLRSFATTVTQSNGEPTPGMASGNSADEEDWVVDRVQSAITNGEIDESVYAQIRRTSLGAKAASLLRERNVQIVDSGIPEGIFKPLTNATERPSAHRAPVDETPRQENPVKKMKDYKNRIDRIKEHIPGYRGARVVLSIGAAATLVVVGIGSYKIGESLTYDPALEICNSNTLVCGGLKFFDGLIGGAFDQIDKAIPGGKR